ncbi:hypothetical protein NHG23_08475 [Aerococcaceae bacterium NML190073]|nr:hypothetical protein [Aerococcaceae bacterium NML190073]
MSEQRFYVFKKDGLYLKEQPKRDDDFNPLPLVLTDSIEEALKLSATEVTSNIHSHTAFENLAVRVQGQVLIVDENNNFIN